MAEADMFSGWKNDVGMKESGFILKDDSVKCIILHKQWLKKKNLFNSNSL